MPDTTRLGHPYPDDGDSVDVPADIQALAESADNLVPYSQGLLAARPVSTIGTPGIQGRKYYATDEGIEYLDTGTSWIISTGGPYFKVAHWSGFVNDAEVIPSTNLVLSVTGEFKQYNSALPQAAPDIAFAPWFNTGISNIDAAGRTQKGRCFISCWSNGTSPGRGFDAKILAMDNAGNGASDIINVGVGGTIKTQAVANPGANNQVTADTGDFSYGTIGNPRGLALNFAGTIASGSRLLVTAEFYIRDV